MIGQFRRGEKRRSAGRGLVRDNKLVEGVSSGWCDEGEFLVVFLVCR